MDEKPDHKSVWMSALAKGVLDPVIARQVLEGYKAGLDLPFIGW